MLSYHILFYRLFLVFNFVFGVHVCVIAPGGQSMTCKSEFLSSTVCIPWTNSRCQAWQQALLMVTSQHNFQLMICPTNSSLDILVLSNYPINCSNTKTGFFYYFISSSESTRQTYIWWRNESSQRRNKKPLMSKKYTVQFTFL